MGKSDSDLLREISRVYAQLQRKIVGCCGITSTQCQLLCAIGENGRILQSELINRLGLEKSWISRAVDTLEKEGLVERDKCCGDARRLEVVFTETGRNRFDLVNHTLDEQVVAVMECIPETQREGMHRALEALCTALSSLAPA